MSLYKFTFFVFDHLRSFFITLTSFGKGRDIDMFVLTIQTFDVLLNFKETPCVQALFHPAFSTHILLDCPRDTQMEAKASGHFTEGHTTISSFPFSTVNVSTSMHPGTFVGYRKKK
jgi:hypothetical protein